LVNVIWLGCFYFSEGLRSLEQVGNLFGPRVNQKPSCAANALKSVGVGNVLEKRITFS